MLNVVFSFFVFCVPFAFWFLADVKDGISKLGLLDVCIFVGLSPIHEEMINSLIDITFSLSRQLQPAAWQRKSGGPPF